MNHKELVSELAGRTGWTPEDIEDMLSALGTEIGSCLVENDTVYLQGLGQFETKKITERIEVDSSNGKRYLIPPKLVPLFKPEEIKK